VETYEEASQRLRAESDRADQAGVSMTEALGDAITTCGLYRAEIALFPVSCLADILLKVRAFAVSADTKDEEAELREQIERQGDCAYADDIGIGVMIDLMRLGGVA
jgi:hypothetical protein